MNENVVPLQSLMVSIEQSLEKANKDLEHNYLNHISSYFDENGRALTKTVIIENDKGKEENINIPLISLVCPKQLSIEKVNLNFTAYVVDVNQDNDLLLSFKKASETEVYNKIEVNITVNSNVPTKAEKSISESV